MRCLLEKNFHVSKLLLLVLLVYIASKCIFTLLTFPFVNKAELSENPNNTIEILLTTPPKTEKPFLKNKTVPKPIFVIKTYYYPNSRSFNGSDGVVTLFNAERYPYNNYTFTCNRTLESGSIETSVGTVLNVDITPFMCELLLLRLTCLFPMSDEDITEFYVGVTTETNVTEYGELTVSPPNKKKYGFVSCMSRMVAGDDWAMVIFAMEVFRLFGGDLAVAPVECVITQVMDLLRLYEKDGILKVQPGFKPRALKGLGYYPTKETEYANQMSTSHECFYEYKDTAEFISFPDWDDMLILPRKNSYFPKYFDIFSSVIQSHPNAAGFNIDRIDVYLNQPIRESDKYFSLAKLVQKTFYDQTYVDPKMVIRPHLVVGNWIHELKRTENIKYKQIKVNSAVAIFAHWHYSVIGNQSVALPQYTKPHRNASDFVESSVLDSNFRKMLKRHSYNFDHKKHPHNRLFHGLIGNCYLKIIKDIQKNGITYCPTPTACDYGPQKVNVVKIQSVYNKPFTTGPFVWHERRNTKLVKSNKGCL